MYDIVIIGAGVVGGLIARELSKYKLNICILEKEDDVACGSSKANSGLVHAGFDAKVGTLKAKLNVLGSNMMEELCSKLNVEYKKCGALVVAYSEEEKESLNELYMRGKVNGVKSLKILEKEAIKKIEPNISEDVKYALYAETAGIVSPYGLTISAIGNAMDNGVKLKLNFKVQKIEKENNLFSIYSNKNEKVIGRFIINCAGIYSDEISKFVGDNSFKITPRRGEYILLDKECGNLLNSTIFKVPTKMGKGILITKTVDGNILMGPTAEDIKDKANLGTTKEGLEKIINGAKEKIENIPFNKTITSFTGLRAVGDTGDFIINSNIDNFINVAGIESPGLSASPAIAIYVKDMIKEMGLNLEEKENFILEYYPLYSLFNYMSDEEKNEIIKKDSRYGKIICRCEEVTEGQIVDAICRNPKAHNIDAIKRRTRASLGRCQGGFCIPYIVEILSKELNTPFENITKSGKSSYINIGKTKKGGDQ